MPKSQREQTEAGLQRFVSQEAVVVELGDCSRRVSPVPLSSLITFPPLRLRYRRVASGPRPFPRLLSLFPFSCAKLRAPSRCHRGWKRVPEAPFQDRRVFDSSDQSVGGDGGAMMSASEMCRVGATGHPEREQSR